VQQAYNTQILVDATTGLIVGLAVSTHAADTTELGPVLDSTVDGRVRKAHFTRDAATNRYRCPQDQALEYHRTRTASRGGGRSEAVRVYRSAAATCAACPLTAQRLPKGRRTRTVERGPDDPIREAMAAKVRTPAGAALYRQRKGIVEPVFGILKEVLGFRHFIRRGIAAVTSEFTLLALAYNLKVLARGTPRGGPVARRRPRRLDPGALARLRASRARGLSARVAPPRPDRPGRTAPIPGPPPAGGVAPDLQRFPDGLLAASGWGG